jgi:hypothetical protein
MIMVHIVFHEFYEGVRPELAHSAKGMLPRTTHPTQVV